MFRKAYDLAWAILFLITCIQLVKGFGEMARDYVHYRKDLKTLNQK